MWIIGLVFLAFVPGVSLSEWVVGGVVIVTLTDISAHLSNISRNTRPQ